jgi:DNA repair protein RadC
MSDKADVVLYAPTHEIVSESSGKAKRNPASRKRRWTVQEQIEHPFGEFASLLVRTALIRAEDFKPQHLPTIEGLNDILRLVPHLRHEDQEHFVIICLDHRRKVVAIHDAIVGTNTEIQVDAGTIAKVPLLVGARSVVIVHNHPGGIAAPGKADRETTRHFKLSLSCVGVELVDHVVIGFNDYYSFNEHGEMPPGRL